MHRAGIGLLERPIEAYLLTVLHHRDLAMSTAVDPILHTLDTAGRLGREPVLPSPDRAGRGDYILVERAIRFIEQHARKQPTLLEIAEHVGASESHLQRVFTRWAGISPKRFLQYLTHEHCRQLLRQSRSVLDATYEAGLSSAGRLHDLFVTVEAVTPGEFRTGGAGLDIRFGIHDSPFGECLVATTPRGVCAVSFLSSESPETALERLHEQWPGATIGGDQSRTAEIARRMFDPEAQSADTPLRLLLRGTNFQINVWKALLRIPLGSVASYEDLAAMADVPGAPRAVGNAVGANPLAYVIPCHRVIRKTGEFGNYGGGPARKKAMLVWESARAGVGEAEG
jgi:AraC family transcriptional regulator of adaptative response/methylated-DNA-[protein]-cysteine methyltransferase